MSNYTGTSADITDYKPDLSSIPSSYWSQLNKHIVAEVNATYPTFADLKAHYAKQLVAIWTIGCALPTIVFALSRIILH